MNITVRTYQDSDVSAMVRIWNEVVEEGLAFPQEENLTEETGRAFFREQTHCGVAVNEAGTVLGMYILHPNNVGRCGHICNTSYAVAAAARGLHIGEQLVMDSLKQGKTAGSAFFSSTRWWPQTFMRATCTSALASGRSAPFPRASG